jgi:hypothetical protein
LQYPVGDADVSYYPPESMEFTLSLEWEQAWLCIN